METISLNQNQNHLSHFASMSISELKENAKELKEYLLVMEAKKRAESPNAKFIDEKEAFDFLRKC
ncbi:MAG: hypothetical protein HRU03_06435 [Nanoarchaeales archaeon]|nr:hypothetical protein [Nanoarchaeales archaeon]